MNIAQMLADAEAATDASLAANPLPANWSEMSDYERDAELIRRHAASQTSTLIPLPSESEAAFHAELAACQRWTEHEGCIIHGHMCH